MKIKLNFPSEKFDKNILENKISEFKAILIIESIKKLSISNKSKKEILKIITKG